MRKFFTLFVAFIATSALWAEQFEANGLRYTITSESTVEVAGYDWYDQVLTIPSEVTGPVVKNEERPELPNPGAGKITICVQVAQPFCEGVSIVIPGVEMPGSSIYIPFFYGLIALATVLIVHEFSHGFIAYKLELSSLDEVKPFLEKLKTFNLQTS